MLNGTGEASDDVTFPGERPAAPAMVSEDMIAPRRNNFTKTSIWRARRKGTRTGRSILCGPGNQAGLRQSGRVSGWRLTRTSATLRL